MDNAALAEALLEVAEALDFLDENPFRARAYRKAAHAVADLREPVRELVESGEINHVRDIGPSIGAALKAWVLEGDFSLLSDLRARLPHGHAELLKVPGLGTRKLRMLHRDLGISGIEDLLAAIEEGRLAPVKGFTEKGIARLRQAALDVLGYRGWFLMDAAWGWMDTMITSLRNAGLEAVPTGVCRRGMEVMDRVELLCREDRDTYDIIPTCLDGIQGVRWVRNGREYALTHPDRPPVTIRVEPPESLIPALFVTTGSGGHLEQVSARGRACGVEVTPGAVLRDSRTVMVSDEAEIYALLGMPLLPPEIREGRGIEWDRAASGRVQRLISADDIRGVLHIHTTMSDGRTPLADMVQAARDRGYEWVGISDHSRSAYYAGGLSVKDLRRQQEEIARLNDRFPDIAILSGIESEILPDGSLDYGETVLKGLDFVFASIHSHMNMEGPAMTERIIKAIRNPCTSVIGHPTGRLLLSRRPYALDMEAILEEAARCGVAVELNAHPMRLDIDWRLVPGFVERGGRIVITPDAHTAAGLDCMRYGIVMARKGLVEPGACLNALDADHVKEALRARWS
ncbi:MAG TPA: PHP domain-containing protein [Deltaproteobacteria bacterium]|nr:PHP domain-containing protein [Deltaproteobacteria bacterium]